VTHIGHRICGRAEPSVPSGRIEHAGNDQLRHWTDAHNVLSHVGAVGARINPEILEFAVRRPPERFAVHDVDATGTELDPIVDDGNLDSGVRQKILGDGLDVI